MTIRRGKPWRACAAVAAAVLLVPAASAARSLSVREEGRLRFLSSSGSWLTDEGPMSGTIPGRVRVGFEYNGSPTVRASFTIYGSGGSIRGHATGRLKNPNSPSPSFRGSLAITGGSGRYARARGTGELFGVFYRRSYGLTVQAIGTLRYSPARAALARQSAKIGAKFSPERLGAHTTTTLAFSISGGGRIPSPLTGIDFRYPANLGIATSDLGTATCDPAALEVDGPAACPPNSVMGKGSAAVEVPLGPEIVRENAALVLVAGPSQNGYVNLLVSATGRSPVAARIVMPTLLENGHLHIAVPLVPSLPEGPDVAVVRAQVTLGGRLTYYEHAHGRTVAYHPRGIVLPRECPRGGFRFAGTFTFLDGTRAAASTSVACPRRS